MKKIKWVKCTGEAHNPEVGGMIDNCMACAPYWENIATCPVDGTKLINSWSNEKQEYTNYWCTSCRHHYSNNKTTL